MTRNRSRRNVTRQLTVATTALLGVAVAVGLIGGTRAREASAGAVPLASGTASAPVPGTVSASVPAGLASGPAASASASWSVPAGSAPASAPVPASVPPAGTDPGCLTDDLAGTLIGQDRAAGPGVRDAVLRLTNTSGRTCRVEGWADIALVTPPGELVRVPTGRTEQAGGGAVIVLKPQASTWARVQWDTCAPGRAGCGVGVAVQYIVDPDSTGAAADNAEVPEADRDGIAMRALRVGPLRATRAAALA
ncbi:DUF4232 domain-containing protein [Actinoplanes sp. NPDC023801]|uniref:DUF4232 domain-containing protein n=1 Tax=Actinoplanes sp. NPDC023801 TaxID=3154595 RepID=UPI00340A1418